MKKIKKERPVPARTTNDLLDFLRADKKEVKEPREKAINYQSIPSKRPEFRRWKRKDIEQWKSTDFIGYFLYKYLETVGEECIDLKRTNKYLFAPEKSTVKRCFEVVFNSDTVAFRDYIDFIIPWWVSDESWVSEKIPKFNSVFTQKSTFYSTFKTSKTVKPKGKSRKELDNHYASSDAWAEFLEDDE
jgi:hypothetical protein